MKIQNILSRTYLESVLFARRLLILSMILITMVACATTNNSRFKIYDDYITQNNLESVSRVTTFKFQGWNSLDDRHLILSSNFKKSYLIVLANYCNDLQYTPNIIVDQTMNSRLSSKFDAIIVPGQNTQKCVINRIYKITQEQLSELRSLRKNSQQSLSK
ncbi:hypothetical protein MNBD_GAMMA01-1546 [hydrothermal vent metagenome]|uniref:Lipoprotein n=1 Tax=hydrothermal vent metagenome TaxID=652676 RepID=A0A3B0VCU6_9ZZZZ